MKKLAIISMIGAALATVACGPVPRRGYYRQRPVIVQQAPPVVYTYPRSRYNRPVIVRPAPRYSRPAYRSAPRGMVRRSYR